MATSAGDAYLLGVAPGTCALSDIVRETLRLCECSMSTQHMAKKLLEDVYRKMAHSVQCMSAISATLSGHNSVPPRPTKVLFERSPLRVEEMIATWCKLRPQEHTTLVQAQLEQIVADRSTFATSYDKVVSLMEKITSRAHDLETLPLSLLGVSLDVTHRRGEAMLMKRPKEPKQRKTRVSGHNNDNDAMYLSDDDDDKLESKQELKDDSIVLEHDADTGPSHHSSVASPSSVANSQHESVLMKTAKKGSIAPTVQHDSLSSTKPQPLPPPSPPATAIPVTVPYVEPQRDEQCGLHAMNAILGAQILSEEELRGIVQLMAQEWHVDPSTLGSDSGNYNIDVLREAFIRFGLARGPDDVPFLSADARTATHLEQIEAVLVNDTHHYYALKKVTGQWWCLDSMQKEARRFTVDQVIIALWQADAAVNCTYVVQSCAEQLHIQQRVSSDGAPILNETRPTISLPLPPKTASGAVSVKQPTKALQAVRARLRTLKEQMYASVNRTQQQDVTTVAQFQQILGVGDFLRQIADLESEEQQLSAEAP